MYKQKRAFAAWAIIVVLLGLLAGCSSANHDSADTASRSNSSESLSMAEKEGSVVSGTSYMVDSPSDQKADADEGSAVNEAGGGFAAETAADTGGLNQKIIYTATLSMQVDKLEDAATSLRNAIHQSGGYILQFQDTRHEGEIGSSYTIKVPAAGFMSFIDRIEQIKHDDFERNIGGKDVSEEYVDLESRLKAKQMVETRLLTMMETATKADDLLKFSDQLAGVQEEVERIKGRIRYLDKNVAFSTVELRMYQKDQTLEKTSVGEKQLGGRMSEAISGSTKVVWETLKLLLVVLAGAVPVVAVLVVIAVPSYWLMRRRKKKD
ncbi:hypothetical protein BK133_07030 [Paenibacillus sp. FSL H8-0548]|uniref:DUF4349 domain-containing protein n=1 Tax=Paenibacillus sp. FSL H8-0548 TaxID=1920422 RepID=UPI00096E5727|nr:DUF4349 domain-containing protein [Paenibacillus sp. FSL H8-0548]OMF36964.1 hypothetical protein BK133_07030 [Paenibacillus sp. FSL H8-0548]